MSEQKPKPTVKVIPADPRFKWKKEYERQQGGVGIYCRVSTAEYAQLRSLSGQVSDMLQYVKMKNLLPKLEDIYIDIRSGTDTNRPEFDRMLADVKNGRIKTVVTRTVQRFGRNTDVVMDAIRTVRNANAHIIFVSDDLDTDRPDDAFEISIRVAMSHEDSKAKSANIKWAIRKGLQSGTSKFYNKACYGYKKDKTGKLVIDPAEAKVVRFIVAVYLEGESLIGIKRELEAKKIPSPTGKDAWSIRTIQNILRCLSGVVAEQCFENKERHRHFQTGKI